MKHCVLLICGLFSVFMASSAARAATSIATARAAGPNVFADIGPVVVSETNDLTGAGYSFCVQDSSGGATLYWPTALMQTARQAIASNSLRPGSIVTVQGSNSWYSGLYEISYISAVISNGVGPALVPIDIDITDVQNGAPTGEICESMLVRISGVTFANAGNPFVAAVNQTISKNSMTAIVRVQDAGDPLVGTIIPAGACNIQAILSQFTSSGQSATNGYQLLPVVIEATYAPFVDITNAPVTVTYDVTSYAVAGTNTLDIVGGMWVSNATAGGAAISFSRNGLAFIAASVGLGVGTNTIRVYGTNLYGVIEDDSVVIARDGIGTRTPFVDVTNADAWVTYDTLSTAIGGSNNISVVGLWWSNSLTSSGGTCSPGSPWWTINDITLNVGANVITVYGTNTVDMATNDSVMINEIMYNPPEVGVDLTEYIEVYNSGSTPVDLLNYYFSAGIAYTQTTSYVLEPGAYGVFAVFATNLQAYNPTTTNIIGEFTTNNFNSLSNSGETITLRNSLGQIADTVLYGVAAPWPTGPNGGGPSLELTDPLLDNNQAVSWAASVNGPPSGTPGYANSTLNAVYGTNGLNATASDSITVTRGGIGTGVPYVEITNVTPPVLSYDVTSYTLGITNNMHVVGTRRWVNALTSQNGVLVNNQATIPLGVGANLITVTGTNEWNISANDNITITRGGIGTGAPYVDITNATPRVVGYASTTATVGGTNNENVVGVIRWQNLTGGTAGDTTRVGDAWTALITGLLHGDNTVQVIGTNLLTQESSDGIVVHRKTAAEAMPQIASNALIFPSPGAVLSAPMPTNIIWWVNGITDDEDGTNVTINCISVHVSNTVAQVAVVTNTIDNWAGLCSWLVPESLAGGGTTYVVRFEVTDSSGLTNSMIFNGNAFMVVPEGASATLAALVLASMAARKRQRQRRTS